MAERKQQPTLFQHLRKPRDLQPYDLMTGVTDFSNLVQFNLYETGYAALIVVKIPKFLDMLADKHKEDYGVLIQNYKHILEREFKSLDGLSDITSDALEISDGINQIEVTGKVTMETASTFSMKIQEKAGSTITKVHELYLTGLRDPRGGMVKHYHGLIGDGLLEPGFENECFTFLYINTDNTMRNVERAVLIVGAQPTTARTSMYNYEKGDINFVDIDPEFRGFPIMNNNEVDRIAQEYLDSLHTSGKIIVNSSNFNYYGIKDLNPDKVK